MTASWSRRRFLQALALAPGAAALGRPGLAGAIGAGELPVALAEVRLASEGDVARLAGFDLAEARRGDVADVVLWPGDETRLARTGIPFRITVSDLRTQSRGAGYRRLADYEADLAGLAERFPGHARLVVAPVQTFEDRTVLGVEVASDVADDDGRPVAMLLGLHHAREWPSGELAMDFARELAEGFGRDPRITALLQAVRLLVVPVVNPDGFHHSRRSVADTVALGVVAGGQGAYWRKNRRGVLGAEPNLGAYGVDPNRNYGHRWGSGRLVPVSATSSNPLDGTYQGQAPFSEPESANVRQWVLQRGVVALITNHTYSNLVLWPWGHTPEATTDGPLFERLGAEFAAINGYTAQQSWRLYPTTGSTEDWAYAAAGTLGFTFEHGRAFHPDYASTYPALYAQNRDAFLRLLDIAADESLHGVVEGTVVARRGDGLEGVPARLRLTRFGLTPLTAPTASGERTIHDTVDLTMTAAADGRFAWHVNPSTRPIVTPDGEDEPYQLTVTVPGGESVMMPVVIGRGQRLSLGTIPVPAA